MVAGDEGSYLPNGHSNLAVALHAVVSIGLTFLKHNRLSLSRFEPSVPVSFSLGYDHNRAFKRTLKSPYYCCVQL